MGKVSSYTRSTCPFSYLPYIHTLGIILLSTEHRSTFPAPTTVINILNCHSGLLRHNCYFAVFYLELKLTCTMALV